MTPTVTRFLPAAAALWLMSTGYAEAGLSANWEESGLASYYSSSFDGRRTAAGRCSTPMP